MAMYKIRYFDKNYFIKDLGSLTKYPDKLEKIYFIDEADWR